MMLSARQEECYKDRIDIFRPVVGFSATTGLPTEESYTRIAVDVPAYIQLEPNIDEASVAGRIQRKLIYTMDIIHTDRDQELDADYIIKNVSLNDDGTRSQNYGRFWRILGLTRSFNSRSDRAMGKKSALASTELVPPQGVE